MEEALNIFSNYQSTIVTIISTIVVVLGSLKISSDKYLKYLFASGDLAEKYADVVDKVEEKTSK